MNNPAIVFNEKEDCFAGSFIKGVLGSFKRTGKYTQIQPALLAQCWNLYLILE
ncbi:UNVERIFIED_ORG: hypothetical protein ABRZ91_001857 [Heyndrickxia coagulans]